MVENGYDESLGSRVMKIIIYAGVGPIGEQLVHKIRHLVSEGDLEHYDSIDGFVQRLRRPVNDFAMVIICAGRQEEISEVLGFADLMVGIKTILIVPDRLPQTLSDALKLHPRYVGYADGDFSDVSLVAGRMLQRHYAALKREKPGV
jgi:hypothetical protein